MNRSVFLALAVVCATACSKKSRPAPEPTTTERQGSVAEMLSQPAATPPAPASIPSTASPTENNNTATGAETTKGDSAIPPDMARHGRELARVMMLAQKQALSTGHFPKSWDEMIAAKLITQPPTGKNGKPMAWKEFVQAMDK